MFLSPKKKIIFIATIIVLVLVPTILYFYSYQKITLINNARSYNAFYVNNQDFLDQLKKWKIIKDGNLVLKNYTVKRVLIETTDISQNEIKYANKSVISKALYSSSGMIKGDTFKIKVYLSPEIMELPNEELGNKILLMVLDQIYSKSDLIDSNKSYGNSALKATFEFNKVGIHPFKVEKIN